ncbi:hypothetical protein [Paracoccus alkanivorans]|uniref:Hpt domain-containing protein n=1 Tax=Paracoccus alkanivorans TaxID=2116655 RepID=A0A3M0MC22_9RHOB|nr:hypothetical protein [Paracoccus alkanivorans]RMC34855.1 hypothetical protein C9E81_12230 [Paracoccus alkanivorans]
MPSVTALPISEPVRIDRQRFTDIIDELGERTGRNVIDLALEQFALVMTATEKALARNDFPDAVSHAALLTRLAWQIGLPLVAIVAQNLGNCIEQRDLTALAAIRARLARVGNNSLTILRGNGQAD